MTKLDTNDLSRRLRQIATMAKRFLEHVDTRAGDAKKQQQTEQQDKPHG